MKLCLAILLVLVILTVCFSSTINVPGDYSKIQDAINAAMIGDTILVEPGTYMENIVFNKHLITVRSDLDGNPTTFDISPKTTIIDGSQSGSVVVFENIMGSVLQGFTIKNGTGNLNIMKASVGGGIYCNNFGNAIIRQNIINKNKVEDYGGGIYCENFSSPIIEYNTISENEVTDDKGGGGGICCRLYSNPIIRNNLISKNTSLGHGGGIRVISTDPEIANNIIEENNVLLGDGGGICCSHFDGIMINNLIINNYTEYNGGGVRFWNSYPKIINNLTVVGNQAEFYNLSSNPRCNGGGIYCEESDLIIHNSIIWGNSAHNNPTAIIGTEIGIGDEYNPSTLHIEYCDTKDSKSRIWVDNYCTLNWGSGMISSYPEFVSGYYLGQIPCQPVMSPCVDTGNATAQSIGMDHSWTRTDCVTDSSVVDLGFHYNDPPKQYEWTFFVYMAADNSLSQYADGDLTEMMKVGSDNNINIVTLVDKDGINDTHFYKIIKGSKEEVPLSNIDPNWGSELDMANPATLVTVSNYVYDNYPTENISLILWNHGSGWRESKIITKSILEDKNKSMKMKDLGGALENIKSHFGSKIDLLGFDACLMGMLEVAYEIRNHVNIMVGSEMVEPGTGWSYDLILNELINNPNIDSLMFSKIIVDNYGPTTTDPMSAADLNLVSSLATNVSNLANTIIGSSKAIRLVIKNIHDVKVKKYIVGSFFNHIDLFHFADLISQDFATGDIHDAAENVKFSLQQTVKHVKANSNNDNGLAIYFPENANLLDKDYNETTILFAKDFNWDEFLVWYFGSLFTDINKLPESTGGSVNLSLEAGNDNANKDYLIFGSVTGTNPGISMGGDVVLPINWDIFTNVVIGFTNSLFFQNFMSQLDYNGENSAKLNVPPIPGFAGTTMFFAYALVDNYGKWNFASNPVEIEIVP